MFEGSCHCGAIGFVFRTSRNPESWSIRACQCSFCRRHGARTTSDPAGSLALRIDDGSLLAVYRFGLQTADFLICRRCGVYVAAMLKTQGGRFATINVNVLDTRPAVPEAVPMSYAGESAAERARRRAERWTPVSDGARG